MSTESTTTTKFVKVSREQFDNVLRVGTPEFLKRVSSFTQEELQRGERWINELRAQKGKDTYLTFPVSQPKQQAAGVLYLKAMSAFRTAVRTELAARAATSLFGAPAEAEAVAA
jgi:hypothetical protein